MGAHPNHVKEMIEICQTTTKKMFKNNDGKKKKRFPKNETTCENL
jgi:hypothetical protein